MEFIMYEAKTLEEIIEYQKNNKPIIHKYCKYGNLAKKYLE